MSDTDRVEFNCPLQLLEEFDKTWKMYYKTRTEALLELMRSFVRTWKPKES